MSWAEVPVLWQTAFELAWASHEAGSNPIGALVADAEGAVVSSGKSAVRAEMGDQWLSCNEIAHAEPRDLEGPEPALAPFSIFLNVYHDLRAGAPADDPVHAAFARDYDAAVATARQVAAAGPLRATSAAGAYAAFQEAHRG